MNYRKGTIMSDADDEMDDLLVSGKDFPNSKAYFKHRLLIRMRETRKLLQLDCPDIIAAQGFVGLFTYAIGYCGKDLLRVLSEQLIDHLRRRAGFCPRCDSYFEGDTDYCPKCERELKEEYEANNPESDDGNGQV
jgi:hypothetical protein